MGRGGEEGDQDSVAAICAPCLNPGPKHLDTRSKEETQIRWMRSMPSLNPDP